MWGDYYDLIRAVESLEATVDQYGRYILYAIVFFGLLQFCRSLLKGGRTI